MCSSAGKRWPNYKENAQSKEFLATLSLRSGISEVDLIKQDLLAPNGKRHAWVHRRVAINLAAWLSSEFAVWVTELVEQFMTYPVQTTEPFLPPILHSLTGIKEWTAAQFYLSQILGDSWESLKSCDGADRAITPADRTRLFILKFGHQDTGSRQTTHIREFGGDYKLLDSFPTPFSAAVESRVRNWLRAHSMLMEGKHSKRDGKDTELCGVASVEEYASVVGAVRKIIADVEADMRGSLQMSTEEPLELRLERVRQQAETQRYQIEQEQKTARYAQRQQTKRLKMQTPAHIPCSPVASMARSQFPRREQPEAPCAPTSSSSPPQLPRPPTPPPCPPAQPQFDQDMVTFQILADSRTPQAIVRMKGDEVIYRHPSLKHAVEAGFCKPGISSVLHNSKHTHAGFKWVYGPPTDEMLMTVTVPFSRTGAVVQLTPTGAFVNSYPSASRASAAVGVTGTTIMTAIRDKKLCHLHRWTVREQ